MKKFSTGQLRVMSEIFGNISVAWFVSGVISPLLMPLISLSGFLTNFLLSLIGVIAFFRIALKFAEKIK